MKKEPKDPNKPDVEKDDPHRQIIPRVTGLAAEIFEWLEGLFDISESDVAPGVPKPSPDTFPDSVVLKMAGRSGSDQGSDITRFDWKATAASLPSREKLVEIANDIVRSAQKDANALGRSQRYGLFAYSNRKGAGAYSRLLFNVEASIKGDLASDDEDTHRDREIRDMRAHHRWMQEQHGESMSGMLRFAFERIRQLEQQNQQLMQQSQQQLSVVADALLKKQELEINQRWADIKIDAINTALSLGKAMLPAVQIYLTKGKTGIVEGLRMFLDGLGDDQRHVLFGKAATPTEPAVDGLLTEEQALLILGIAEGKVDPRRVVEFVPSLTAEQLGRAQEVLRFEQIQQLAALAEAARKAVEAEAPQQQ